VDGRALIQCDVVKTDASRRLVFGWLIVCTKGGKKYRDTDKTHVPDAVMLDGALDWARTVKAADVEHSRKPVGSHPFLFPMTAEVAKAIGWENPPKTGLLVGQQVDAETFARFESGELKAFSVDAEATAVFA